MKLIRTESCARNPPMTSMHFLEALLEDPNVLAYGVGGSTAHRPQSITATARDFDAVLLVRDRASALQLVLERPHQLTTLLNIVKLEHPLPPSPLDFEVVRFAGFEENGLKKSLKVFCLDALEKAALAEEAVAVRCLSFKDKRVYHGPTANGDLTATQQACQMGNGWAVLLEQDLVEATTTTSPNCVIRLGVSMDLFLTSRFVMDKNRTAERLFGLFWRKIQCANKKSATLDDLMHTFRQVHRFSPEFIGYMQKRMACISFPSTSIGLSGSESMHYKFNLSDFLSVCLVPRQLVEPPQSFTFDPTTAIIAPPTPFAGNCHHGSFVNDGKRYFWKKTIHWRCEIENSALLAHAYPHCLLPPLKVDTEAGVLVYPWIEGPTLAELRLQYEQSCGGGHSTLRNRLLAAEMRRCELTLRAYCHSAVLAQPHGHLLNRFFHERLRPPTRLVELLPQGVQLGPTKVLSLSDLRRLRVHVNGTALGTLDDRLAQAERVLCPAALDGTLSVLGLGDAHGGNILVRPDGDLCLVDLEAGGRYSPWLDLVKPLYNDLFFGALYHDMLEGPKVEWILSEDDLFLKVPFRFSSLANELFKIRRIYLVEPFLTFLQCQDLMDEQTLARHKILGAGIFACALLCRGFTDKPYSFLFNLAVGMLFADGFDYGAPDVSSMFESSFAEV